MKLLPLAIFLFMPTAAALVSSPQKITVELNDQETGQPVAGASVLVHEFHTVAKAPIPVPYASSSPTRHCLRGNSGTANAAGATEVELPAVDVSATDRLLGKGRDVALLAYAPGYCIAEAQAESGSERAALVARRDTAPAVARARYLKRAAMQLSECRVSRDNDYVSRIQTAIRQEISALEKTIEPVKRGRGFAIVGPTVQASGIDWSAGNGACAPGDSGCSSIQGQTFYPPGVTAPPGRPLKIVCRDPGACDFDRRFPDGRTALYQYIHAALDEHVVLLLGVGADPNIEATPGGTTGIDALFAGPIMQPPGRIDAVLRTVQALATDGRVTVSAETARKLATPLGPWINPPDPETVAKFQEVLRLAATFPVRRHPELVCNDRFSKPGIGERY